MLSRKRLPIVGWGSGLALSLAGNDGEAWALLSRTARTPAERKESLERAVELSPSPKNYRELARLNADEGNLAEAAKLYRKALERDPNNLLALRQLADIEAKQGSDPSETLNRLIAVEASPYFQIRAIPELVPTETYEARLLLAARSSGDAKLELLKEAVKGFAKYRDTTLPTVKRYAQDDPSASYGGENLEQARRKMEAAAGAADQLASAYRERKDGALAAEFEAEATKFKDSLPGDK